MYLCVSLCVVVRLCCVFVSVYAVSVIIIRIIVRTWCESSECVYVCIFNYHFAVSKKTLPPFESVCACVCS